MSCEKSQATYWKAENIAHVASGIVVLALGILSLAHDFDLVFSVGVVVFIDLYLLVLLVIVALRSDSYVWTSKWIPDRLPALILLVCLFLALIFLFANTYAINGHRICNGEHTECLDRREPSHKEASKPKVALEKKFDAIYFSIVTIATVGYGDFVPVDSEMRRLVAFEIINGMFLVLVAIPLLISRLATWTQNNDHR